MERPKGGPAAKSSSDRVASRKHRPPRAVQSAFEAWCRAMQFQRAVDRALRDLELTHTQYWVLACAQELVEATGDAVSQQRIAETARLDKMTVSFVVRKLEGRGFLDRDVSASGLALRVVVTTKGQRTLSEAAPLIARVAVR